MSLSSFCNQLAQVSQLSQLKPQLRIFLAQYGIHTYAFTYYSRHPKAQQKLLYSIASNNLQSWHEHYIEEHYDEIDTTLNEVYRASVPICWSVKEQLAEAGSERERQMRRDALDFGAQRGVSIPLHGPEETFAILMIQERQGESCLEDWTSFQAGLFYYAHQFFLAVQQCLLNELRESELCLLSQRALQCLKLTAEGLSVEHIAKLLNITQRTVHFHIQKANKILGCKNKYHSINKLFREGVLKLS